MAGRRRRRGHGDGERAVGVGGRRVRAVDRRGAVRRDELDVRGVDVAALNALGERDLHRGVWRDVARAVRRGEAHHLRRCGIELDARRLEELRGVAGADGHALPRADRDVVRSDVRQADHGAGWNTLEGVAAGGVGDRFEKASRERGHDARPDRRPARFGVDQAGDAGERAEGEVDDGGRRLAGQRRGGGGGERTVDGNDLHRRRSERHAAREGDAARVGVDGHGLPAARHADLRVRRGRGALHDVHFRRAVRRQHELERIGRRAFRE